MPALAPALSPLWKGCCVGVGDVGGMVVPAAVIVDVTLAVVVGKSCVIVDAADPIELKAATGPDRLNTVAEEFVQQPRGSGAEVS